MICPHCKNEIPDDSLFCVDCGMKIPMEDSVKENQEKEHREDFFQEDDVVYYSLNPSGECDSSISERWKHGDNCGGSIYVGNNAMCLCGKCYKTADIKFWHKIEEEDNGNVKVDITTDEQPLEDVLKILPIDRAGLKWLNEITSKLITKD